VVDVGVETGLLEGVEGSGGGASADEPGLVVHVRVVAELAVLPDVVGVATDEVGPGVAGGGGVDEEHRFADFAAHGVLAGDGPDGAVEDDVGGDQAAHHVQRLRQGLGGGGV